MRKAILVVAVLLFLAGHAFAEPATDKGVYSLSGTISYTRADRDGMKTLGVAPAILYFIEPNLAVGTSIQYDESKLDQNAVQSYYYRAYGVGPVIRYYFGEKTTYPFVSVAYLYTKSKTHQKAPGMSPYSSTAYYDDLTLGLGADYFLSKNVALEPMVRYTFGRDIYNSSSSLGASNSRDRSENLFIGVGVNAFIF